MDDGFGSGLWENVQAVRLGPHGGIEAPVRANERDGVVVGVHRVAAADEAGAEAAASGEASDVPPRPGWWTRLLRH